MTQAVNIIQSFRCAATAIPPYRIVGLDGVAQVVLIGTNAAPSIGISTEVGGDAAAAMDVTVGGIAYLQIGAITSPATLLTADGVGQGIGAALGNRVVAVLLEAATVAGQVCKVALCQSVF